jgi:hypothetical protein
MGYDLHLSNGSGEPLRLTLYDMRVIFGFLGAGWADVLHDPGAFELSRSDLEAATRSPEVQARFERFQRAYHDVLDRPAIVDGKVGLYKWSSNDGWLVTPDECRLVAAAVRAAADRIVGDYLAKEGLAEADARALVDRWVAWHEQAAGVGGYRVR